MMPRPTHTLVYERDNGDGTTFHLNANITAKAGHPIVNLDTIRPLVQAIACNTDHSIERNYCSVQIYFTTEAYELARSTWPTNFVLVTSGDARFCGYNGDGHTFYK